MIPSPAVDITDDSAFEVLQEVLGGRRRDRLDDGSSKVLRILLDLNPDCRITQAKFEVHFGSPRPMEYFRSLAPAAISELLKRAKVDSVDAGTLIHLPAGDVAKVRRFVRWSHDAKDVWILPGPTEVLIRVRKGDAELKAPSAEPCQVGARWSPLRYPPGNRPRRSG